MRPRINRQHSDDFKLKVCAEIRSGSMGRREAQRFYKLSDNLIHAWLARYDGGKLRVGAVTRPDARLRVLKRKIGELLKVVEALDKRPAD